jgi:hypothetical protein
MAYATWIVVHVAYSQPRVLNTRGRLSTTWTLIHVAAIDNVYLIHVDLDPRCRLRPCVSMSTWPTVDLVYLIHVADCRPRGQCATCSKYTRLKRQSRGWHVPACPVWHVAQWRCGQRGHVADCIILNNRIYHTPHTWRTVCHVYGPHTCGNLQVATWNFFCSIYLNIFNIYAFL